MFPGKYQSLSLCQEKSVHTSLLLFYPCADDFWAARWFTMFSWTVLPIGFGKMLNSLRHER